MAQIGVGLTTGSNAKLRVGGLTLAYATDISYSVDMATIPAEIMGKFEVCSNEPISYSVSGSFTILRYITEAAAAAGLPGVADKKSNSPANWGDSAGNQLNPGAILQSTTFDLEVFQKFVNNPENADVASLKIQESIQVVKITGCRITRRTGGVSKRGMYTESYQFVGVLMNDDKTNVSSSGLSGSDIV